MSSSPLARRWLETTPSLKANALRASFLRSEICARPLDAVASALDALAGMAEQANPVAREVLAAAVPLLCDPRLCDRVDELRRIAAAEALLPLGRLLRVGARESAEPPAIDERKLATSSSGRVLTLGERRALARRPSRAAFEKLLRDPHPMVIASLLQNPRITEDDVVRLAARRPAYPDVITEIVRHPEWPKRVRVRMAIVQNPGSPQAIAVPLVRLLIRPELHRVLAASCVPAVVRAAAQELLARRPPVPEPGTSGTTQ